MTTTCAVCALLGDAWRANPTRALVSRRMFVCGALRSCWMVSRDPDRCGCAPQCTLGALARVGASAPAVLLPSSCGPLLSEVIGLL